MKAPYCPECKAVVEAVAFIEGEEIGIVINTEGSSAGRYADGTFGTTSEVDELAEEEETVFCLPHLMEQRQHVECDWIDVP